MKFSTHDLSGMLSSYHAYLEARGGTYMVKETGKSHASSPLEPKIIKSLSNQGYAGVALNFIESINDNKPIIQILNVANNGAINGMNDKDVVEIPTIVMNGQIQPVVVGNIPTHSMGLIKLVKHFEHLTIEAAIEGSYQKARLALTLHPLVSDYSIATKILNEYISQHKGYFPDLH